MSYTLNNIKTANDYTDVATLQCPFAQVLNIQVSNKPVYYQFAVPSREQPWGGSYGPEKRLLPGFYPFFRRAAAVRFRSAVAGESAVVDVEALTPEDRGAVGRATPEPGPMP